MEDSTKIQKKEEQKQKDQKNNNKKEKNELVKLFYDFISIKIYFE